MIARSRCKVVMQSRECFVACLIGTIAYTNEIHFTVFTETHSVIGVVCSYVCCNRRSITVTDDCHRLSMDRTRCVLRLVRTMERVWFEPKPREVSSH